MSFLRAAGFTNLVNMTGACLAWQTAGLTRLKQRA